MNLVFHIGLPRVASTTLQQSVFPASDEINFVNFKQNESPMLNMIMIKNLNHLITKDFLEHNDEDIKKAVLSRCKKNMVNVVSNEDIYSGEMWVNEDQRYKRIEKLKRCFPNSCILLGIRNKEKLLLSWYKKYIVNGGVLSFNSFKEEWIVESLLDWQPYCDFVTDFFDDVYVYRLADVKNDFNKFIDELFGWLGCRIPDDIVNKQWNRGYSLWQLKFARLSNNLFQTKCNPDGLLPIHHKWIPYRIIFQSNLFPEFLRGKEPSKDKLKSKK